MKILLCTTAYDHAITGAAGVARIIGAWGEENPDHQLSILSEDCDGSTKFKCVLDWWCKLPVLGYYFKSRKYATYVCEILTKEKFDIVLFMDMWLASGIRNYLKKTKARPTIISFMHDDNTMDMPSSFGFNGRSVSHLLRWLLERSIIRGLDRIITNSEYMKRRISAKYQLETVDRLYYAAHDYSKIEFLWKEYQKGSPVRILFVKNDFIRGGLSDLLAALNQITNYRFELTIVGPPRSQVVRKLNKKLQAATDVNVNFLGPVTSSSRMIQLYHHHDLVCVPSRREALGMAIAEAITSGTPVVTTTAGGICEVMNGMANGFLSPPGDVMALAASIRACLSNTQEAFKRTSAGREFVMGRFDMNGMLQNLESILFQAQTNMNPISHHSDSYDPPNLPQNQMSKARQQSGAGEI